MLSNMEKVSIYNTYETLPFNLVTAELEGIYGSTLTQEMTQIAKLYDIYDKGADFNVNGNKDYVPNDIKCKKAKKLIDEEARFMFSKPVDFNIKPEGKLDEQANKDLVKEQISIIQSLVETVLRNNNFNSKVLKAAKDCFIGKRIAIMLNFNDSGISIQFAPSLEFVYDTDENDINTLKKLVCFFTTKDDSEKANQRINKKKYWMAEDGYCHVQEAIYDGNGNLLEELIPDLKTLFLYIPGTVIVNDGLTGDMLGRSDIGDVAEFESVYSKYSNKDLDAEGMSMNPIRWARDMNPESTKDLSIAPGAFWDLSSDVDNDKTGEVGQMESNMSYSNALDITLRRIENNMYEQLSVPNINLDTIKGIITSGKGMKAIYWPLIVRCDEKILEWKRALEFIANCIVDGSLLYPNSSKYYTVDKIPDIDFSVEVENNYSLPEDEVEEKTMDIQEVNAQTMSKRSYMKKWRRLTDDEADQELKQITLEKQMLEDNYIMEPDIEDDSNDEDVDDITKKPDDTRIKQNI